MNVTPPPTNGLVAGKYQLISMIGRGGMGSVWEARHVSLGTRFAIKFIESEYANSQEARSRFDREARSAAALQSKHAIQIYDHGVTDDGKPYIVMELLVGEPLDKRVERMGRLSLQDTARILGQVCRALARAHTSGIVHRDLKPENIFLVRTQEDDEEIAKVLDFGIAKVQADGGGMSSSTKTGAVLGTPYYMSPEQARGLRNVDHRTDLWSLGVIAYRCIVGRLPFDGESVGDLLVKICTSPLPVPSSSAHGIPASFDAWFQRALDREPANRFQSAQELADALAFAAGLSIRTGTPSSVGDGASRPPGYATPNQPGQPYPGGGTPMPNASSGATPQPAAMTGSPFTTSASPKGGSKAKVAVLVTALGALVAGGVITATAILKSRTPEPGRAASGLVAAPEPPPTHVAPPPQPPTSILPASATTAPPPVEPAIATKPTTGGGGGGGGGSKTPAKTPTTAPPKPTVEKPPVVTPPAPTTPPAASTAPAKKPPKDVTGY